MPLHPQARAFIDQVAPSGAPGLDELPLPVTDLRQLVVTMFTATQAGPPIEVARVEDRSIPGPAGPIPVRVYTPQPGDGPFPVLVYFHGGGWVICNLDTHDATCRGLAKTAGCVVVSVDYRLAPEHRFPAAAEDCYAAAKYVVEHAAEFGGDPKRVAIGGDSAGGNLTAVVAQMARDKGGPRLVHQLLIYPATDAMLNTTSMRENATGYFLTTTLMEWFWNHYAPTEAERQNPYASPLRAADLRGLPPATVLTAEFDPLRDEGEAYAAKLSEAGVPVRLTRYDGMIHGFFGNLHQFDDAERALDEAAAALRASFR
jgi:acetyl esterase